MLQDRKRVVWFEGMTLDPHHFQQWDRFHQGVVNARVRALARFDWGFSRLEVDRERLANGEFVLVRAAGILPDGLPFDMPDADDPPPPRNVQEFFPPTQERLGVYLATPAERQDGGNFLLQGAENRRETRFRAETAFVADENSGVDERQVEVARSVFTIRFGGEALHSYTALQIADVRRSPAGGFVLDEPFVPTVLSVAASERLQTLTRRLLEILVTKSTSLGDRYRGAARQREVSPADVMALGLLATVNQYIPLLNHHHTFAQSHPEALFLTLLGLGGGLTAYLPDAGVHPRDFPGYDHTRLSDSFNRLETLLLEMLGGAQVQANYVQIPLKLQRENLFAASVDRQLLEDAQFFLIARSETLPEERLVRDLPGMLRIASLDTIDGVLRAQIRALPIEHTHRLPSALPVDQRANYFELQKRGPFWDAIRDSNGLALFVPKEVASVDLKLVAVKSP